VDTIVQSLRSLNPFKLIGRREAAASCSSSMIGVILDQVADALLGSQPAVQHASRASSKRLRIDRRRRFRLLDLARFAEM
jgi:hypothetical protein